jgi:hypothetical protein
MATGKQMPMIPQSSGNGLLDWIVKPAEQIVKQALQRGSQSGQALNPNNTGNMITKGVNAVGQAVGNTPITSIPGSPTYGQALDYINAPDPSTGISIGLPGQTFLSGGMKNVNDVAMGGLMLGTMAEGGVEKPDEEPITPKSELPSITKTGTKITRDMRFKQGTENPGAYKQTLPPMPKAKPQFAGEATAPLNPNAEQLPPQQEIKPPVSQTPPVNTRERTYASGNETSADIAENTKRNLQYTDGIPSPKTKAQVNATLNGYEITGSLDNQLQGIEDQKGILSKAAQAQVAEDGGTTAKADLLNRMVKDVTYNGSKHNIPSTEAANESSKYLNDVYVRATGGDLTKINGDIMPPTIPDTIVQKMKTIMGQDASLTFGKDPTTWSTSQQIARYARNSFDSLLDQSHPEASTLNNDMSDLYKAQDSIMKGANKESTAAQSAILTPSKSLFGKGYSVAKDLAIGYGSARFLGIDPAKLVSGSIAGAQQLFNGGANNVPYKPEDYQVKTDSKYYANQSHILSSSIPRTQQDVKPDQNGNYPVANPQNIFDNNNTPLGMSLSDYTKQNNDFGLKVKQDIILGLQGTPQYATDAQALDTLQTRWKEQPDIQTNYNKASAISSLTAKIKSEVAGLSDNLLTTTTFDNLSSINNGTYRGLKQDIQDLASAFGTDPENIWQQQNSKALKASLDSIGQQNASLWNQYVNYKTSNTGASNLSNTSLQTPPLTPTSPLPKMSHLDTRMGSAISGSSPQQAMQQAQGIVNMQMPSIH